MYGKIIDGRLVIAGNKIEFEKTKITNPTEEMLKNLGYKEITYNDKPKYDNETEKLVETYKETSKGIEVSYTKEDLSNEEKNYVLDNKISAEINSITKLDILKAISGDKEANSKINGILKNIATDESKKVEIKGGEEE